MTTQLQIPRDANSCPRLQSAVCGRLAVTLLEVTAAAAMLAVLVTISMQMLRAVGGQQRATERRALALMALQAVAEQIGNMRWDELTSQAVERVEIPAVAKLHLPGAMLGITVEEEQEPVAAKRVTIKLVCNGPNGQTTTPLRLTTWVFADVSKENQQ